MECKTARIWLFRLMDRELSESDSALLHEHLAGCPSCEREFRILALPRKLGSLIPALEPSPFFYERLRARIREESQSITLWQILWGLSRQVVPALAAITLILVSIAAYEQFSSPQPDIYQAYDRIFTSVDRPVRMVIAEQGEITEESVLQALAEQEPVKSGGKK